MYFCRKLRSSIVNNFFFLSCSTLENSILQKLLMHQVTHFWHLFHHISIEVSWPLKNSVLGESRVVWVSHEIFTCSEIVSSFFYPSAFQIFPRHTQAAGGMEK